MVRVYSQAEQRDLAKKKRPDFNSMVSPSMRAVAMQNRLPMQARKPSNLSVMAQMMNKKKKKGF